MILDSDLTLIPYGGSKENSNNLEIIGIGKKVDNIPAGTSFNPSNNNVFLIFDNSSSNYHLRSFQTKY